MHASALGYRLRLRRAGALLAALATLVGACAGRRGPPPLQAKPNTLDRAPRLYGHADSGLGLPEGLVGAGIGYAPLTWAAVEAGGGLSTSGPQAAAMATLRGRVSEKATLGVGSGVSIGQYLDVEPDTDDLLDEAPSSFEKTWHWVLWSNTQVQLRHALSESVALRGQVGFTFPASQSRASCDENDGAESDTFDRGACQSSALPELLPYLGFGVEMDL